MDERPSKSARKREHLALQALGEKLVELTDAQLEQMPLDEPLRDAVIAARGMKSRGALRRQRQLIGKLMARADAGPIRAAYDRLQGSGRSEKALFRRAEEWRDRILREGRPAVDALVTELGRDIEGLGGLVGELGSCRDDAGRRQVARRIFRVVHAELASGMQSGAS